MRFDMGRVDHLRVRASAVSGKFSEQVFPNPALCPTHETVVDRHRRAILWRAIAPAAATFQHVHNPADDAPIVYPFDTANIGRQMRLDPSPLPVAQPKQIPAHDPDPFQNESGSYGIRFVSIQQHI
jgi:hypothetical protein